MANRAVHVLAVWPVVLRQELQFSVLRVGQRAAALGQVQHGRALFLQERAQVYHHGVSPLEQQLFVALQLVAAFELSEGDANRRPHVGGWR